MREVVFKGPHTISGIQLWLESDPEKGILYDDALVKVDEAGDDGIAVEVQFSCLYHIMCCVVGREEFEALFAWIGQWVEAYEFTDQRGWGYVQKISTPKGKTEGN